jgi:hypothetical protein
MTQIKIFSKYDSAELEKLANEWLQENDSKIKVKKIKYNSIAYPYEMKATQSRSILIIYEQN